MVTYNRGGTGKYLPSLTYSTFIFRNTSSQKKSSRKICRHLKTIWKRCQRRRRKRQIARSLIIQFNNTNQHRPLVCIRMSSLFGVGTGRQFMHTAAILLRVQVWFLLRILGRWFHTSARNHAWWQWQIHLNDPPYPFCHPFPSTPPQIRPTCFTLLTNLPSNNDGQRAGPSWQRQERNSSNRLLIKLIASNLRQLPQLP